MTGQLVNVKIQGCIHAKKAEIQQAVDNALSNLMALLEEGDMDFDCP